MKAIYQCAKIAKNVTTQHKTIIRFGLVFLFKSLNVFNLSAATKILTTNYTFLVKPTCFFIKSRSKKAMT